ncbi:MAG TPA: HAMP domain-containing sensor histidine kinase [Flavipsychrobacter sp.]|nr:HAMP domain-containing sensor histidine kinase [Flavipsychrobacter sp.]
MQIKKIYGWMAGISLLLIMLIVIQIIWLRDASGLEKRETQLHVTKALERVEEQMRNSNYCFVLYGKAYINPGEAFYVAKQKWDGTQLTGKPEILNLYYDGNYFSDGSAHKEGILLDEFPLMADMQLKFEAAITDTVNYYNERKAFYEKLTGKKFVDIMASDRPIDSVFRMGIVDSLIKASLKSENIDTNYGFAFILKGNNKISFAKRIHDSTLLLNSPYSLLLFTDNRFIKPYRLTLIFTHKPGNSKLNFWLLLSIGIILLLTFSFYAFVRIYIRQTRLSEMKSDFIHNLTHEFNTPMANISLAIETLQENGLATNPKVHRVMSIISAESGRLRDNIERALHVATMEKGTFQLHKENIDLVPVINTVVSAYQLQCEQLGGKIGYSHVDSATIFGDETHLVNCVCNLLDNAIKYRNGPPEISIQLGKRDNYVILSVADNGQGMTSEVQKHIFEKFYRAHEGDVHNTKGFGLGLSYVKGIVDAHNGKIEVHSKVGHGTTFIIYLPKTGEYGTNA